MTDTIKNLLSTLSAAIANDNTRLAKMAHYHLERLGVSQELISRAVLWGETEA